MTFLEAIRSLLSQYVGFSGRASRSEFWFFFLFQFLLYLFINVLAIVFAISNVNFIAVPNALISLFLVLPGLAVSVRRLHDTGQSALKLFILIIPIIGAFIILFDFLREIQPHENKYGVTPHIED